MGAQLLSDNEISAALSNVHDDWHRDDASIARSVEADTFAGGIRLVDAVAVVADERDHHPDIDIRWTTITFRLSSHSAGGLTQADFDLAGEIDRIAG